MMEGEAGPSTIPLYLINGVATIWDAQSMSTFIITPKLSHLAPLAPRVHKTREGECRRVEGDKLISSRRYITLST
jgi:hypothetical protein